MGRQIIKVAPDEDLYLEWSSIVDAPLFVGTRADTFKYLDEPRRGEICRTLEHIDELLRRADETGSSAYAPLGCTWGHEGPIYQQLGWLPRGRLAEYGRRLLSDQSAQPFDLLEPFEDEGR